MLLLFGGCTAFVWVAPPSTNSMCKMIATQSSRVFPDCSSPLRGSQVDWREDNLDLYPLDHRAYLNDLIEHTCRPVPEVSGSMLCAHWERKTADGVLIRRDALCTC
jgi:hypothetical protein